MLIKAGYDISFKCVQTTPILLCISVHPSRTADISSGGTILVEPAHSLSTYTDAFGNVCTRIAVPPGQTRISTDFFIQDSGLPDITNPSAGQLHVESLPDDMLLYLMGSRYCETDRLSPMAWDLFGHIAPGWARVQAICNFVHRHIRFDYQSARSTRTAWEAYQEGVGVCRDYAHLAVTFCRCLNIPARYCTGYLGDIGVPPVPFPGDFSAWFDVFLDDGWYTFDARHNVPRIGRILMARGRDATDVAIATVFGPSILSEFTVWTDEA